MIRNFLVTLLRLLLNAKCSWSLWSKLATGHRKWFLNTNLFLIKTFIITKFDVVRNCWRKGEGSKITLSILTSIQNLYFYSEFLNWNMLWMNLKSSKCWNTNKNAPLKFILPHCWPLCTRKLISAQSCASVLCLSQ